MQYVVPTLMIVMILTVATVGLYKAPANNTANLIMQNPCKPGQIPRWRSSTGDSSLMIHTIDCLNADYTQVDCNFMQRMCEVCQEANCWNYCMESRMYCQQASYQQLLVLP